MNPLPLRERQSRPESAAGEPTPLSAPQAGIFRSGPRATRFAAAALLSSLGSRSCCSQQRSSSTACRSRACERASLLFTSCLLQIFALLAFFFRRGGERGGGHTKGGRAAGAGQGALPSTGPPWAAPGGARRAPTGHLQKFLAEVLGGRRQLGPLDGAWGPKIAPRGDGR